jgi:hypothetical protein
MSDTHDHKYHRTFEELEAVASKFWPSQLSEREARLSVIPLLLKTQDQFINIISIETPDLEKLFNIIESSTLPANLFLKHLAILADFGGEPLQRISGEFEALFPQGVLNYGWQGQQRRSYTFRALPNSKFSNQNLHIDGRHLVEAHPLDDLKKDAIALLLFGSAYAGDNQQTASALVKCEIGDYLGRPRALQEFIKQRYIWVSRITGGAKANNLGQLAQQFVAEYIQEHLGEDIEIQPGGRLPDVTHTDSITGRETAFDLVITHGRKYVAVEVSFQVTTNSTIERKAGQAKGRYEQVERAGHRIAYVIDGAGNFERETAMRTMLTYSHCSVAFSRSELDILCEFLKEFFRR